ncbi:hypothetical protein BJX66DRAFT_319638, partial [Aspergillus keveii]
MTPSTARTETKLVMLLSMFVQKLPKEATINPNNINFRRIIREFNDKAPKAAQAIAQVIQDNKDSDPSQEPAVEEASSVSKQGRKQKEDGGPTPTRPAKRRVGDTSYKEPVILLVFGESPGEELSLLSNKTLSESGSGEESRSTTSEAVDSNDHDALIKWINKPCSPQTEEIHRDKIPESVVSLPPTHQATPESININTQCTKDLIIQAVRTIHGLSTHRDSTPNNLHQRILQSLQGDEPKARAASSYDQWSDGSTWKRVLEIGASQQDKVEHAKGITQIKKKKQVGRRGAAITRIHMQLSRGQKLCTQIVGKLGLGILFDQKIWKYTKSSIANINNIVKRILEDEEHKKLLDILELQLKLLIENGTPDLAAFFENLVDSRLVIDNELRELQVEFPLGSRSLLDATLDTAIDHLVELVSTKVLNKATPESGDTVAINSSIELSCEIFNRLRPGKWLDSWTIMALMQISDRPAYVKYDLSIPLDEPGSDGQIRQIKRPLASWAKKITQHRREAKDDFGEACPLVYFCPINHRNKHFTLLEINERKQVICHYDSMADSDTILGVKESRLAGLVRGEFKNLKYSYIEVVSAFLYLLWAT